MPDGVLWDTAFGLLPSDSQDLLCLGYHFFGRLCMNVLINKTCLECINTFETIATNSKKSRKLCRDCYFRKRREVMIKTNKNRVKNKSIQCQKCLSIFLAAKKNAKCCPTCRQQNDSRKSPTYLKSEHYRLKSIEWSHNHRARAKGSLSKFHKKYISQLLADYNHQCVYCGSDKKLTVDHLIPIVRGGSNDYNNLTLACLSCNSAKRDKMPLNFLCYRISK